MTTIKKRWIQTYPGCRQVFPLSLDPEAIRIVDIFWALSNKCRFTGHCKFQYSVAQHCVLGAQLMPLAFRLPFLLHEVSEAYLPDVAAPVKPALFVEILTDGVPVRHSWQELEARHADVIFPAIGLASMRPLIDAPEIKEMDLRMLAAEKEQLTGPAPDDWQLPCPPANVTIIPWSQTYAFDMGLAMFNELTGRDERFQLPESTRE